jgi:hypothetical protein
MPIDDNFQLRRLQLDLATEIDPIQGQIIDDRGKVWPFTGWLDLVEVLERHRRWCDDSGSASASADHS